MKKMIKEMKADPKFKKLVKVWFPITILLIRKMKLHCEKCTEENCTGCKFFKLNCLLDEIDEIINEDNLMDDFYEPLEKIGIVFTNEKDDW